MFTAEEKNKLVRGERRMNKTDVQRKGEVRGREKESYVGFLCCTILGVIPLRSGCIVVGFHGFSCILIHHHTLSSCPVQLFLS